MARIDYDRGERDERFEYAEQLAETSTEVFDRLAYAERAVALVRPPGTTVAIGEGRRAVRLASGRQWGAREGARWALLLVPPDASRGAIAAAVLGLGGAEGRPWSLDVLVRSAEPGG